LTKEITQKNNYFEINTVEMFMCIRPVRDGSSTSKAIKLKEFISKYSLMTIYKVTPLQYTR
jgi:hypothetical protein